MKLIKIQDQLKLEKVPPILQRLVSMFITYEPDNLI